MGPWKFALSSKFDAARGGWGAGIPPQAAPLPPQSVGHFLAFFAVGPAPDPPPARGHTRGLGGGPGLKLGLLTRKAGVQRNLQGLTSTRSDVCALSGTLVAEPAPRFIPRERHTMRGGLEVWQCTVPEIRWDLESSWGRGWGRVEGSFLYCTHEVLEVQQLLPLSSKLTAVDQGEERAKVYSRRATIISQTPLQRFQFQCLPGSKPAYRDRGSCWRPGWVICGMRQINSTFIKVPSPSMWSMAIISATWGMK